MFECSHQQSTCKTADQRLLTVYLRFLEVRDCFPPARAAFSNFRACCFFFSASRAALVSYLIFFPEVALALDVPDVLVEEDIGFLLARCSGLLA